MIFAGPEKKPLGRIVGQGKFIPWKDIMARIRKKRKKKAR